MPTEPIAHERDVPRAAPDETPHWLVRPDSIRLLWKWFAGVLAVLVLAGLVVHIHPYFGIDGSFGFYAWYGLGACALMVFGARMLGKLLKVPDDYYLGEGSEPPPGQGA